VTDEGNGKIDTSAVLTLAAIAQGLKTRRELIAFAHGVSTGFHAPKDIETILPSIKHVMDTWCDLHGVEPISKEDMLDPLTVAHQLVSDTFGSKSEEAVDSPS